MPSTTRPARTGSTFTTRSGRSQSAEAEIAVNTMADAAGLRLPPMAPLLHFSKRQDMVCWAPERLRQ